MSVEEETKIQVQELSRQHRNCFPAAPAAMKLCIVVAKNSLNDEKTHRAINTSLFKRLDFINEQLYEVKLAKAETEHREPIIVGFFILQYAQLRVLELY